MAAKGFAKGNQYGKVKTGKPQKRTLLKKALGLDVIEVEGLKQDVLNVWRDLINDRDKKLKAFAAKELSKYLFPTKKEMDIKTDNAVNNVFIIPAVQSDDDTGK